MERLKELNTPLKRFRFIALLEGISFLVLLFIAMPLKRMMGLPIAVTITGWAHGVLFISYLISLLETKTEEKWSLLKSFFACVAAVTPFGTFVFDKYFLKKVF